MTQATPTKEKQNKLNKHTHELDYILFGFYFLFNGRGDITQGFRESWRAFVACLSLNKVEFLMRNDMRWYSKKQRAVVLFCILRFQVPS